MFITGCTQITVTYDLDTNGVLPDPSSYDMARIKFQNPDPIE